MTENIKLVVVGDGAVGKTCLLIAHANNGFPDDYVPTVFDNYGATELFYGQHMSIGYWDTAGHEDYERLRPLSYPETNVFLICFDLTNRESFENVKRKWMPEILEHVKGVPVVVCGTKLDLRETHVCVTTGEGMRMAMEIGAHSYQECSAKRMKGLRRVIYDCVTCVLIGSGMWTYYIPEDDQFHGHLSSSTKKKKVVVSSPEEFRRYNFRKCLKTLKSVKKEFIVSQKQVKALKVHMKKLSDDVVFYIFHHFYLFDYRTCCSCYRTDHSLFQEKLEKLFPKQINFSQDFFLQCFGYFSRDKQEKKRKVFQLFYNFKIDAYPEFQILPKLKKSVTIDRGGGGQSKTTTVVLFRDYLNFNCLKTDQTKRKVRIMELQNINFPTDYEFLAKYLIDDEKQTLRKLTMKILSEYVRREFNSYDFLDVLNKHCNKNLTNLELHRNRPSDRNEAIRVCRYDRNEFKMMSLEKLVLDRYVMNEDLRFCGCANLRDVSFIGSSKIYPLELRFLKDQFYDLLKLERLQKIRFLFYNLSDIEAGLYRMLSEYEGPLEEIIIHRCMFEYRFLKSCSFRNLKDLKLLVITHHLEMSEGQEEFPRDFLIRVGERTKDVQFLLRSSQKGAFSNMKQEFKLKVIRKVDSLLKEDDILL